MKTWSKPELYVEEFVLSQHVAANCGTTIVVPENGKVTMDFAGCEQAYNSSETGHWGAYNTEFVDVNNNGVIDWDEYTAVVPTATNGKVTGNGHQNHGQVIVINGTPVEDPFTS